jgi:PTH1 family peptidyl-tRNA hydrolase
MTPPSFLRSLFPQRRRGEESERPASKASPQTAPRIRLIVGLGNPGGEHSHTRHNRLGRHYGIPVKTHTSLVTMGQGLVEGSEVILAKPRTYVNRSGEAVAALVRRYKVSPGELLVVCDNLDLPVGAVRVRSQGGHGGHKGLQSIIKHLGIEDFPRIRIGIGRPLVDGEPAYDPEVIAEYVLSDPPPGERRLLDEAVARAIDLVACVMTEGLEAAMNRFNR